MEAAVLNTSITDVQLSKIKNDFSRVVSGFSNLGVSNYECFEGDVRVFVDFGFCLREVDIDKIEILDEDYEEIYSENALALRRFIKQEIADYNKEEENREQKEADELAHRNYVMFETYF